jgi:radical SAM protein
MPPYTRADFAHSPMLVFYETTRACDLACVHCRADAQPHAHPLELSPTDALRLIDDLARFPRPPLLVLTGGDPLKRKDIFDQVHHAAARGLSVAMTPSATPLVTDDALRRLKDAGLHRIAVSLDGADAETHDGFRRVRGSFQRTMDILSGARAIGLPLQLNITVMRQNVHQLEQMLDLGEQAGAVLLSVFFLVPTGRATLESRLDADACERVFERLWTWQLTHSTPIKTTEAPHYRRFVLQRQKEANLPRRAMPQGMPGTNDGKGILFVSHTGQIYPSGFLPRECGRFPRDSIVDVYQHSPLFQSLRDPDLLAGKCGQCEFRELCGGSRARAFAVTGAPLASDPDCVYEPRAMRQEEDVEQTAGV